LRESRRVKGKKMKSYGFAMFFGEFLFAAQLFNKPHPSHHPISFLLKSKPSPVPFNNHTVHNWYSHPQIISTTTHKISNT